MALAALALVVFGAYDSYPFGDTILGPNFLERPRFDLLPSRDHPHPRNLMKLSTFPMNYELLAEITIAVVTPRPPYRSQLLIIVIPDGAARAAAAWRAASP